MENQIYLLLCQPGFFIANAMIDIFELLVFVEQIIAKKLFEKVVA